MMVVPERPDCCLDCSFNLITPGVDCGLLEATNIRLDLVYAVADVFQVRAVVFHAESINIVGNDTVDLWWFFI